MPKPIYILSIDCEATGLSKHTDQIVEIGLTIYSFDNDSTFHELEPYRAYVRPTLVKMSKGASKVTGITDAVLQKEPTIDVILNNMLLHINKVCTNMKTERCLIAYNGLGYDIPLIVAELSRFTKPLDFFRRMRLTQIIDVLYWSRQYLDKTHLLRRANGQCSFKLGDVYKVVCGKKLQGAHGALEDCRAVVDILRTAHFKAFLKDVLKPCCYTEGENENMIDTTCNYIVNPISFVRVCATKCQNELQNKNNTTQKSIIEFLEKMNSCSSKKRCNNDDDLSNNNHKKKKI